MSNRPSNDQQPERLRVLTCPSCGAALPSGTGRVECAYCGTVIEFRKNALGGISKPTGGPRTTSMLNVSNRKTGAQIGGCIAALGILVAVLAIAGVGFATITNVGKTITNLGTTGEPGDTTSIVERTTGPIGEANGIELGSTQKLYALPFDDSPAGKPRSLALVRRQDDSKYRLALLDLAKQQRIWLSAPLSDDALGYSQIAAANDTAIISDERALLGLNMTDGKQRWSAQISDKVCDDCLAVVNKTVVALTIDYNIFGVDLASGEQLWTIDLGQYAATHLDVIGDQVLVVDRDAKSKSHLTLIDAATGKITRRISPNCAGKTFPDNPIGISTSDPLWISADRKSVLLISNNVDTCAQSYDLTTGKQRWQTILDSNNLSLERNAPAIESDGKQIIGSGSQILSIDLSDGSVQTLFENADYHFVPLAVRDGVIATIAVKQRGTQRAELWGVSAAGKQLWRRDFKGSGERIVEPFKASGTLNEKDEIWSVINSSQGLIVWTITAKPYRYTFETLDAKSGQVAATTKIDMPGKSTIWVPDIALTVGDVLYIDDNTNLIGFDIVKGTRIYQGP